MTEQERLDAWLAERRKAITATDVASIMGVGYGTRMDVFLDKMNMSEPVVPSERMKWGLKLQRLILEEYAERTCAAIAFADPYELIRAAPPNEFLGATLDARRVDDGRPIDAKNVGFKTKEWGDTGSDKVPNAFALQLHVQMLVTGTKVADLAVLFGGNRFDYFTVPWDDEVGAGVLNVASAFWREHIETGFAPPVDGSEGWQNFLKRLQQRKDEVIVADDRVTALVKSYLIAREAAAFAEERKLQWEQLLKQEIGDKAGITSPEGDISWRQSSEGLKTDFRGVMAEVVDAITTAMVGLNPASEKHGVLDGVYTLIGEATKRNTKPVQGSRRFLYSRPKGE